MFLNGERAVLLIECVPNVSEGRDKRIIDRLAKAVNQVSGVRLLDADMGYDTNRTVFTFVGDQENVVEAAYQLILAASKEIDMSEHQGTHPRLGAVDVCPFIPLDGAQMPDAVLCARELAGRIGFRPGFPVYLYGYAARSADRFNLSAIRKGEYEALEQKLCTYRGFPDHGPALFNPHFGALTTGARSLMAAYNINLKGFHLKTARKIAARVRGSGRTVKGNRTPGLFHGLKAIGWDMPHFKCSQVSMNIMDLEQAPIHLVYEAVSKLAEEYGTTVTGSELVGLIPKTPLIQAGRYWKPDIADDHQALLFAAEKLGLSRIKPFLPEHHVLEYALARETH